MLILRSWRLPVAVMSTLTLVTGAAAASSAPNTSRTAVGEIAFSVQHGDNDSPWDIYVVRTDGRWVLRKTTRLNDWRPVWSPDGRHIAFEGWTIDGRGDVGVYTMNPDGTHRRRLAPGDLPQWSPDGRRIAYANYGIYVMNADGTSKKHLTRSGGRCQGCDPDWDPHWSPDGKQIAFTRERTHDVYVVNASGGRERRLTRTGDNTLERWGPGRKLIFTRSIVGNDAGPASGIYIVNADGTGLRKVKSTSSTPYDDPQIGGWSPDAQLIVYALKGLSTVRPRDGSVRRLTRDSYDGSPTWGPGGREIAFTRNVLGVSRGNGIWIVNRDGSGARHIAAANGADEYFSSPTWAPG